MGSFLNFLSSAGGGSAIGAGVSTVGNLIGGIFQNKANRENAKLAYQTAIDSIKMQEQANSRLMDKSNAFNLEMWNKENEYNSPQAQMERYKAAGLNPNLVATQGTPGNAQGAPQASEISTDYSNYKSGPEKVAFKMDFLDNMVKSVVGIAGALEDLKSKNLDNEDKALRNLFSRSFYESRADLMSRKGLLSLQDYFMRGGDVSREDAQTFNQLRLKLALLGAEQSGANLQNKLQSTSTAKTLENLYRIEGSRSLYEWEQYKKTQGRLNDSLGPLAPLLNGLTNALSRIGGALILKK